MSSDDFNVNRDLGQDAGRTAETIVLDAASEPVGEDVPVATVVRRRVRLPLLLFVATCLSTLLSGSFFFGLADGWKYALAVMTILICHEAGHFFQARRYKVQSSFPYFIPMPFSPIGTLGAVIAMGSRIRDRRALFDIGVTGPLAGLIPTLIFCVIGVYISEPGFISPGGARFGDPLLIQWLARLNFGGLPEQHDILLNPMLFAGWVGLLITALNLIPIGQLDGGHVLYGLLRTKAHQVASLLLLGAAAAVFWYGLWEWTLMLILLMMMGPVHPPTADDHVPLGTGRIVLGWLTLAFIPIGFTPTPFLGGL